MTKEHGLSTETVKQDHRLDETFSARQYKLAELRWFHTMNENNPDRVTTRRYAEVVGRSQSSVRVMAQGYANWLDAGGNVGARSLSDCIELARMGVERRGATEALAEATGQSPANLSRNRRAEIDETLHRARDRAERRGTTVEDEITQAAKDKAKAQEQYARDKARRKADKTALFIELEGHFLAAKRRLTETLKLSTGVFDEDELALLHESVESLKALLKLLDLKLGGVVDVDWDAELRKLK